VGVATEGDRAPDGTVVDEGWGRRVADFATLSEPANCREYVAVHLGRKPGPADLLRETR
jgi:hypothetical protein